MSAKVVHDSEIIHLDRSLNSVVTVIPHNAGSWCVQNEDTFKFIVILRRPIGQLRNEARKLHPEQGSLGFIRVVRVRRVATRSLPCSRAFSLGIASNQVHYPEHQCSRLISIVKSYLHFYHMQPFFILNFLLYILLHCDLLF